MESPVPSQVSSESLELQILNSIDVINSMTMAGDQNLASDNTWWGTNLTNAVLNGTIPQWRLDDMVVRIMSAYYKVGRDQHKVPVNFNSWNISSTYGYQHPEADEDFTQINWHVNVQDDHAALIREIGGASTVLLKNTKNSLPLNKPKSIAVIGEDAHDNPGGPNSCSDRNCDIGTLAMVCYPADLICFNADSLGVGIWNSQFPVFNR
jgi:beta-glucosidase